VSCDIHQFRKRANHAGDVARITAERLVRHLQASRFVLMKAPPRAAPTGSAVSGKQSE
jgi:hypothetical protein